MQLKPIDELPELVASSMNGSRGISRGNNGFGRGGSRDGGRSSKISLTHLN